MFLPVIIKPIFDFVQTLVCFYAVVQHLMEKTKLFKFCHYSIQVVFTIPITVLFMVIVLLINTVFAFYRTFVKLLLLCKHRSKLFKMLEGCDNLFLIDKCSKGIITCVILVNDVDGEQFYLRVMNIVLRKLYSKQMELFRCTRHYFMGYFYFLHNEFTIDELVKKLPEINGACSVTMNDFFSISGNYANADLPKNGTALWELLVCTTPIADMENEENLNTYAAIVRFDHAVGDGIAIYKLLKVLSGTKNMSIHIDKSRSKGRRTFRMTSKVHNTILDEIEDKNLLYDRTKISADHLTFGLIDKSDDCLSKIKKIKNSLKASFDNVVLTAITASLADFFLKNSKEVPESIICSMPLQTNFKRLVDDDKLKLVNEFTVGLIHLPIVPRHHRLLNVEDYLMDRMDMIKKEMEFMSTTVDLKINYILLHWLPKYIPALAIPEAKIFQTMAYTNVPGGDEISLLHGYKVKHNVVFIPKRDLFGIGVCLLSYAGKVQLGMVADAHLQVEREELQGILDGFVKYINIMYEKIN